MLHRFSLAHLTLQTCPLSHFIRIAARTGYDFVSLRLSKVVSTDRIYPLITDSRFRRETKRHIADCGLGVLDVELVVLGPESGPDEYKPFLEAAADLQAQGVIVQLPDPDRQRAMDHYARFCELANSYGLYAVLEFVSWTQTPDLRSAAGIVRGADQPNGGILIDMLHFDRSGSLLEDLLKIPSEWFHFVHLCDAPRAMPTLVEGTINTARHARLFPGEGELKIAEVLQYIPNVPYSLEVPNTELLQRIGPEKFAYQAIVAARNYLKRKAPSKKYCSQRNIAAG